MTVWRCWALSLAEMRVSTWIEAALFMKELGLQGWGRGEAVVLGQKVIWAQALPRDTSALIQALRWAHCQVVRKNL